MVVMVKAGKWGGGTCLCFQGGNVDFMCAYANGRAVQGNWLKFSQNCPKCPLVNQQNHTGVQFVYVFFVVKILDEANLLASSSKTACYL